MGIVVLALVLVVGLLWILRGNDDGEAPDRDPSLRYGELEQAEREVRDLGTEHQAGQDIYGDDWGPGVPRPPERL